MINLRQYRNHPELKRLMEEAYNEILMNEAENAAIRLRKSLEYILRMYCKKYSKLFDKETVDDMIKVLNSKVKDGYISPDVLNNEDIQMFFDVKKIGNQGAHDSKVSMRKVEERYYDLEEFLPKFLNEFD